MKASKLTARQVIERERECVTRQQCDRNCARCDLVMEAEDILAAYDHALGLLEAEEKTGMTPEDVKRLDLFREHIFSWSYDRLIEIAQAEQDGRLVVLPCKVGDIVYRVWKVYGRETEITEHKMENIVQIAQWLHLFGKTVFTLRSEAEAYATKEEM